MQMQIESHNNPVNGSQKISDQHAMPNLAEPLREDFRVKDMGVPKAVRR